MQPKFNLGDQVTKTGGDSYDAAEEAQEGDQPRICEVVAISTEPVYTLKDPDGTVKKWVLESELTGQGQAPGAGYPAPQDLAGRIKGKLQEAGMGPEEEL